MPLLAAASAASAASASDSAATLLGQHGGFSWWQTAGGLLLVFGLLVVFLKLLGRLHRQASHGRAEILSVWNLGPRREIQILRLDDEVHTIYRHDGAMVPLKREPLAAWQAAAQTSERAPQAAWSDLVGRFLPRGGDRSDASIAAKP